MGCDIFWKGTQPDLKKQKQCGLLLETLFNLIYDPHELEIDIYDQPLVGYFLDFDNPSPITGPSTLNLSGLTYHLYGRAVSYDGENKNYIARQQVSFVFNNTPSDSAAAKHNLITFEPIKDFSKKKYREMLPFFENTPRDPEKAQYGIYMNGGNIRVDTKYAYQPLIDFCPLKKLYIADLDIRDDYLIFEDISSSRTASKLDENITLVKQQEELYKKMRPEKVVPRFLHNIYDFSNSDLFDSDISRRWGVRLP